MAGWPLSVTWVASGLTVASLASLLLLLRWRREQPLKFRGPWLLFMSGLGVYLTTMWVLLVLVNDGRAQPLVSHSVQCGLGEWVVWLGYPLMVLPVALRLHRLHRLFGAGSTEKLTADPRYWRKLVTTEAHLLKILAGIIALMAGFMITRVALRWEINMVGYGCGNDVTLGWLGLHAAESVLLGAVLYGLRHMRDDFGAREELVAVGGIWVLGAAAQFAAEALHNGSVVNGWFGGDGAGFGATGYLRMGAISVACRNTLLFAVSVLVPLCRTHREPFAPLWSSCDSLRSLESLLKDPVCVQHFRRDLTVRGRAEGFLCWVEIELYTDLAEELGPGAADAHAVRIVEKYLTDGAELEVRVSDGARSRVQKDLARGDAGPSLFREVQLEVFQLMLEDFPLFLASDACRDCMQELEREEHLRSVLQHSNML